MVGSGSRLFFALAAIAFLSAVAYGIASGGHLLGVISIGYKGGVGDLFGYSVFVALGVTSLGLGLAGVALRDADPSAVTQLTVLDAVPEVSPPASASPWPIVGAFGVMVTLLGLVVGSPLFVLGLVLLVATTVEWAVKVWADRATGDPAVNLAIRNRLMAPVEIPVAAILVIAFLVLGFSRVLLAVSATAAVVIGSVVATLIVIGALMVLSRPRQSTRIATALLVVGALAVLAGGIAGVAAGERDFHESEPAPTAGE